jgi:hypothetical protein
MVRSTVRDIEETLHLRAMFEYRSSGVIQLSKPVMIGWYTGLHCPKPARRPIIAGTSDGGC